MVDLAGVAAFVPAAVAVILAPGPDTFYTLTQSLTAGRAAGLVAGLGTATGILVHTTGAVLGLSALLRASAVAFAAVKYVGAAYLVYLGVQTVRGDTGADIRGDRAGGEGSLSRAYRNAVVVNVTNPKVAVFVLAFFPQFVPARANPTVRLSVLGVVYAGLSLCYLTAVALFATRVRQHLLDSRVARRAVRYATGSVLVGVGVTFALGERLPV